GFDGDPRTPANGLGTSETGDVGVGLHHGTPQFFGITVISKACCPVLINWGTECGKSPRAQSSRTHPVGSVSRSGRRPGPARPRPAPRGIADSHPETAA